MSGPILAVADGRFMEVKDMNIQRTYNAAQAGDKQITIVDFKTSRQPKIRPDKTEWVRIYTNTMEMVFDDVSISLKQKHDILGDTEYVIEVQAQTYYEKYK